MNSAIPYVHASRISRTAAQVAIAGAVAALLLLASLHVLSPEFNPSWRMVSEYANGHYGWVLSLMFATWGVSTLALAIGLRPEAHTAPVKIGLAVLTLAGLGEAMAALFDLNHQILHNLAGALGIVGLPIAAMLISVPLSRTAPRPALHRKGHFEPTSCAAIWRLRWDCDFLCRSRSFCAG